MHFAVVGREDENDWNFGRLLCTKTQAGQMDTLSGVL